MRGNTIVDDNHIAPENVANGKYPGRGAGVLIYGGTFVMEGGTISNNVVGGASNRCLGAGLYVSDGGHVTMNDGATILNNGFDVPPGVPTYGANVYLKSEVDQENVDGSFTVLDPTFVMNGGVINGGGVQSATLGGGIFNLGILDINGGTIQNCHAENGGGAIAHFGSSFNIANVTIDGCGEYSDNGYFEENAIISNDEIVVDGSFENVHGTIALGTSELYGEESEDISLADGDYIQTMRTASINVTAESDDGSYEIIFFALVQSYVETIHNCEYRIDYDDYSHMNAFYFDGFEEDEYVSHSDKYIYKTPK